MDSPFAEDKVVGGAIQVDGIWYYITKYHSNRQKCLTCVKCGTQGEDEKEYHFSWDDIESAV